MGKFKRAFDDNIGPIRETESPFEDDSPFVFFDLSDTSYYKIYNDGRHFIGTLVNNHSGGCEDVFRRDLLCIYFDRFYSEAKKLNLSYDMYFEYIKDRILIQLESSNLVIKTCVTKYVSFRLKYKFKDSYFLDTYFDECYVSGISQGLKKSKLFNYIKNEILDAYGDIDDLDKYIEKRMKAKLHNYFSRLKRFKRKAHLNNWNYFVTITFDDKKHDEFNFKNKLRRCLSNLHTRRKWLYMGVFERAPETGRLHFHALMYIPDGEMVGEISEFMDYSTKQKRMQKTFRNSFFAKRFGRNDFKKITTAEMKAGIIIDYISKYLQKTGERIVYSRGIPTEVCRRVNADNVACYFQDFITKFVFYDDIIDWEKDILNPPRPDPPPKPIIYEQVNFAI